MTTAICDDPGAGDPGEFAARVAAWEVELADDRFLARREAAALSAELAMEIAEDPALAVALGLAPDPDLLDDEDGGDPDGRGDAEARGEAEGGDAEGAGAHSHGAPPLAANAGTGGGAPAADAGAGPAAAVDAGAAAAARTAVPDERLSDFALVSRVVELEAQVARVQAVQVEAMVVLAHRSVFRRRDREDTPAAIRARVDGFEDRCQRAAVELSAALTVAPQTAARRLSVAVELCGALPATLGALRAGWLSLQLATLICDETRVLPPALRAVVEAQALAAAADCTPGQLERKLRSWVIAADPKGAAERYAAAKRDRRFTVTALPDGMALLKAVLTADGAQTVATTVDAVAAGMRHHPDGTRDERSVDQRRADALVGICADVLDAGHTGCAADRCGEGCTSASATSTSGPTGADTGTDTGSPARSSGDRPGDGRSSGGGSDADTRAGATAASTSDTRDRAADSHDDTAGDDAIGDDDDAQDKGNGDEPDDTAADDATGHPSGDDLDDAAADDATGDPSGDDLDDVADAGQGDPSGGEPDDAAEDGPGSATQRGNDRGGGGVRGDHEGPGGGHGPGDRGRGRAPDDHGGGGGGGGADPPPRPAVLRRRLARWHGHRPHIQVTVAASTLLGVDDLPGQLTGHGPITADQARRIAADGTWRRLLTDPADGRLLEYGRTHRDPPQELADFVLARDVTDRFPTSLTPAHRCDLDHATAWDDGGTTGATNINAVSPRAHQVRHDAGWSVRPVRDEHDGDGAAAAWSADGSADEARDRAGGGTLEWTSPTGHVYRTPPEQVGPVPGDRLLHALSGTTLHTGQHDDDLPPF